MAYIQLPSSEHQIWVDGPDHIIGSFVTKNKILVKRVDINYNAKHILVETILYPFANINGNFGASIAGLGTNTTKNILLIADSTTLVNAANGQIIGSVERYLMDVRDENGNYFPENPLSDPNLNYMTEFDFYISISKNQPILVDQWIRDTIVKAIQAGRYDMDVVSEL